MYAYWWSEKKNFGDLITPYLIKKITGKDPKKSMKPKDGGLSYFCVGSILQSCNEQSVIWGSGVIQNKILINKPYKVHSVRGPLTKKVLDYSGISCPEIFGDPALLLPRLYNPKTNKKYKLGIIPHYVDANNEWIKANKSNEFLIIDVRDDVEPIIDNILSCEKIISSSLHGLIVADAYEIPSMWVKFSNKIFGDGFKFFDYFTSVGELRNALILKEISPVSFINEITKQKMNINFDKILEVCPFK